MKKIIQFCLATVVLVAFAACEKNEPVKYGQTCAIDKMTFSYYLSDTSGNIKNTFKQDEILILNLDIHNDGQDTLMVHAYYFGTCYDSKNQPIESMSCYTYPDTLPVYSPIVPDETSCFDYAFFVNVPSGYYHYQNPCISLFIKGRENDYKEYTIPLTLNFQVQ